MNDEWMNRFLRYPASAAARVRIAYLRMIGVKIGKKCWIRRIRVPQNPWDISIEDGAALDDDVILYTLGDRKGCPRLVIRRGAYINRFSMISAADYVEIGSKCLIGPYTFITDNDHAHVLGSEVSEQGVIARPTIVGKGAWIGAGVSVLKGVTIGEGAVIGAGSVVTKDVPAFSKVAGVPVRFLGMRN